MRYLHTLLFVLISAASTAQFNQVSSESEITEVTVFTTAAQVTRKAEVSVKAGFNRIKLENLSPFINANSVQVKGFKGITLVSVNHTLDYLNDVKDTEFDKLIKQRNDLIFDREKIRIRMRNLGHEEEFILANRGIRSKLKGVGVEDLMDMSDFYQQRLKDINTRHFDFEKQESELTRKINKINDQLIQISDASSKSRSVIEVTVKAERNITGTLYFDYIVRNAGWYPTYDLRSAELGADINFTYKAMVYQNTGSDWNNVKLALSTGNPDKGSTPPDVYPWRLTYARNNQYGTYTWNNTINGPYQQQTVYFEQAPQRPTEKLYSAIADTVFLIEAPKPIGFDPYGAPIYRPSEADGYGQPIIPPSKFKEYENDRVLRIASRTAGVTVESSNANTQETSVNTVFDIEIPYSIPTDGKKYTVEVQTFNVPAKYEYYVAPRSDNDAFLVAKAVNWDAMNILPGMSSIYFQNTFVGEAYINPQITTDTLELSLGRDKNIVVERKLIKEFSKKVNIGSNRKVTRGYEIKIRNNRSKAIELVLVDQIPVSTDKNIEVELTQNDGGKLDKENGKLMWNIRIEPGQSKTINFRFEVKYPKEYNLPGL